MADVNLTYSAIGVSLVAWCSLFTICVVDPFFSYGVDALLTDLRLRPKSPFADQGFHPFQKLGWRVILLGSLILIGLISGVLAVAWLVPQLRVSVALKICIAVAIVLAWILLAIFHSRIHARTLVLRILFVVPRARRLARQLAAEWPVADGTLAWVGKFRASGETPNMLSVPDAFSRFPIWEICGGFIRRDPIGIIRFDLASRPDVSLSLEFHFNGSEPRSYADTFDGFSINRTLAGSALIGDNVYLAWYDSEFAEINEKGANVISEVWQHLSSEMAKHGDEPSCRITR
jgi:hypothetical protein